MLVLGSVAYMRIGVVLHAVKEREESYWDDYDDREMETMKVPYDQLLVVVDTVVDENPMQDSGDEIDVLMDVPVGETYHVERQQQQHWEYVDDNMPLLVVVAAVAVGMHIQQMVNFLIGVEQNDAATEYRLQEVVFHTFDSKQLPSADLQGNSESGDVMVDVLDSDSGADAEFGAEFVMIVENVPGPQHYDTANADFVVDTPSAATISYVHDMEANVD